MFRLSKDGINYAVIHSFVAIETGQLPEASLVQAKDGALYGTTFQGGINGSGTVFRLNTNGSDYSLVCEFDAIDVSGGAPKAGLIQGGDGILYGTTFLGGEQYQGTIYSLDTVGNVFAPLHSFTGTPGTSGPETPADLVEGSDGALYGATQYGGEFGSGTVFRLVPPPGRMTIVKAASVRALIHTPALSGQTITVETSEDMARWTNLVSGTATNGGLLVEAPDADRLSHRFFRAKIAR